MGKTWQQGKAWQQVVWSPAWQYNNSNWRSNSKVTTTIKGHTKADHKEVRAKAISKALTNLLRHVARKKNIEIDDKGWVKLNDAIKFVNVSCAQVKNATAAEIRDVVRNSDKQRFAIKEGNPTLIRASQGHSMPGIVPDLVPVDLKEVSSALHGTSYQAWESIKRAGLKKMGRTHIHFARDLPGESGVISGMRGTSKVLIWVDLVAASAAGIEFVQSANGVILSEGEGDDGTIAPEYFQKVLDRDTGASLM